MIKRFLILFIMMLSITMTAGAISLQELQSSPNFKLVSYKEYPSETSSYVERFYSFIDLNSIRIVEYNPPKYTLQCTNYMVFDYTAGPEIKESEMTIYYDLNYSLATLIHANREKQPNASLVDVIETAERESGLVIKSKPLNTYQLNGDIWYPENRSNHLDREWKGSIDRSRGYQVIYDNADALFKAVYLQHLDDILIQ